MRWLLCICLAFSSPALLEAQLTQSSFKRVTSEDQRVIVFAEHTVVATRAQSLITKLRNDLAEVFREKALNTKVPPFELNNDLIITFYGSPGDKAPPNLAVRRVRRATGSERFRIEIDFHLAKGFDSQLIEDETLKAILLDQGLHRNLAEGQNFHVPPWLKLGIQEQLAWRAQTADKSLYRSLFEGGYLMEVEDMLAAKDITELDAAQRTALRISAGALSISLVKQPGGKAAFRDYLREIPTFEGDPVILMRKHFFQTGLTEESFAKWWALQLSVLTKDVVEETLGPLETEEALSKILQNSLNLEDGSSQLYQLSAFEEILALEDSQRILVLSPISENLLLLAYRCFPPHTPVIVGYLDICQRLAKGESENVASQLVELDQTRHALKQTGERVRDYLDWYQISNATELSGSFADYNRLKKDLENQPAPSPGKIGAYLDTAQRIYNTPIRP